MIKYSFLMPYHKRSVQFEATLNTFSYFYKDRNDFEVLIGHDIKSASDETERIALETVIAKFPDFTIKVFEVGKRNQYNPAPIYNELARQAQGEYLVITNPECAHKTNVLQGFDEELLKNEKAYVVCSCMTLFQTNLNMAELNNAIGPWYQHSVHRNVRIHFCTVISKEEYNKINGFNEIYANGMCFEDDEFRNNVIQSGYEVITRDDLVVLHLQHSKSKPANYRELHHANKKIFDDKWGSKALRSEMFPVP